MTVSVVIPTWNEATTLGPTLDHLSTQGADEIVVADADSPDGSAAIASDRGVRVVRCPRGRGAQQNRGAAATSGAVLLFLHADCRLAPGSIDALRRCLSRSPRIPGGCFRMRVDDPDPRFRLIDSAAHLRAGLFGLPYGDQGLFVRRLTFNRLGGFPEIPLMDDLFLSLRLRRLGRLAVVPQTIHVSPRRWKQRGLLRQTLTNWRLTALAALGTSPTSLAASYPPLRESAPPNALTP